jgi:hypothetical protein
MNLRRATIIVLFVVLFGQSNAYSQTKSILKLAGEYSTALKVFQQKKSRASVESLLRKGNFVADKLDELQELNESDYAMLEKKMKGFVVNREEVIYVKPDLKFFRMLSKTRGTKADLAFFTVMREIRPDSVWTAYYEMQTDVTGCTIYGNGVLTRLYGKALQFTRNYPKAYAAEIHEEIRGILEKFDETVCACGERAGVLREYRLFIKTFPRDKNTPAIKRNLANIQRGNGSRFKCQTG